MYAAWFASGIGFCTRPFWYADAQCPSPCCARASHRYAAAASALKPHTSSAIAASMWSHGSAWPPGNHGISPDGSCASAIEAADATRSACVSTPGSSSGDTSGLWLMQIKHETLSDQRVECAVDDSRRDRVLRDVPDEHAVVEPGQRMVALHADRTLQPPVRRVQTVCMVRAVGKQARLGELRGQLATFVDAQLAARGLAVGSRQCPADALGQPPRHGHGGAAAGSENT